jgi:CheY-like chemotaxis protein
MTQEHPVVVVDDEPAVLDAVCQMLELQGHRTVCWSKAEEGLAAGAGHQPALALIDLLLPGLDGIQLAQRLRSEYGAEMPLIAMSAHEDLLEDADESGLFSDLVPKPFDLYALVQCIERYLKRSERGAGRTD